MPLLWVKYSESRVAILTCRPEDGDGGGEAGAAGFKMFNGKEVFLMPGFDGTGPAGMGPMTGWGRGYCSTSPATYAPTPIYGPANQWTGFGRGFGRGRGNRGGFGPGFGRGRGFGYRGYGLRGAYPAWGRW